MDITLVVGGSGGIGRAAIQSLSGGSTQVMSASLDEPEASFGSDSTRIHVDITDEASVKALFAIIERAGTLRGVVNAAGTMLFQQLSDTSLADWRRILDVNLTGTFLCCREAIRLFEKSGGGRIVNITSIANQQPLAGNGAYAAAKAGVKMMTAIINEECGRNHIRATALHLGAVDTRAWMPYPQFDRTKMLQPETVGRVIASILRQPLDVRIDELTITPGVDVL